MKVNVSIDGEHLQEFDNTVQELASAGLRVDRALPRIGIVSGDVDNGSLADLWKVPGVLCVEPSRTLNHASRVR